DGQGDRREPGRQLGKGLPPRRTGGGGAASGVRPLWCATPRGTIPGMSCVLLLRPPGAAVTAIPRTARLRDRLAARWSLFALDEALAAGVPADRSAALTLRAQHLLDPGLRARLARDLERAL